MKRGLSILLLCASALLTGRTARTAIPCRCDRPEWVCVRDSPTGCSCADCPTKNPTPDDPDDPEATK